MTWLAVGKSNRRDYDDIPENARANLELLRLERVEDMMAGQVK